MKCFAKKALEWLLYDMHENTLVIGVSAIALGSLWIYGERNYEKKEFKHAKIQSVESRIYDGAGLVPDWPYKLIHVDKTERPVRFWEDSLNIKIKAGDYVDITAERSLGAWYGGTKIEQDK